MESVALPLKQSETEPAELSLGAGQLHLWRARIGDFAEASSQMMVLLSEDERRRANHFRFSEPQERFAIGRGILRCLLSRYTGVPSRDLVLAIGPSGKPIMAHPGLGWLRFNLAHTDDLLLILLARERNVGVDVERVRPLDGMDTMIRLLFTPDERILIEGLSAQSRASAVLSAWTLKEALGKAAGVGLVGALGWAHLAVNPTTALPGTVQHCCDGRHGYCARTIDLGSGYIGALAFESPRGSRCLPWRLQTYGLEPADVLLAASETLR